jgi:hypothetical protein
LPVPQAIQELPGIFFSGSKANTYEIDQGVCAKSIGRMAIKLGCFTRQVTKQMLRD